jgi:hypothetical protein
MTSLAGSVGVGVAGLVGVGVAGSVGVGVTGSVGADSFIISSLVNPAFTSFSIVSKSIYFTS